MARYLDGAEPVLICAGLSTCRLCGKANGSQEFSDGHYLWPEGLGHYIREHGVRLPAWFEQHVDAQLRALGEEGLDLKGSR